MQNNIKTLQEAIRIKAKKRMFSDLGTFRDFCKTNIIANKLRIVISGRKYELADFSYVNNITFSSSEGKDGINIEEILTKLVDSYAEEETAALLEKIENLQDYFNQNLINANFSEVE